MFIKISLIAILLMSIVIPFGGFLLTKRKEKNFKISLFTNLFVFTITLIIANSEKDLNLDEYNKNKIKEEA